MLGQQGANQGYTFRFLTEELSLSDFHRTTTLTSLTTEGLTRGMLSTYISLSLYIYGEPDVISGACVVSCIRITISHLSLFAKFPGSCPTLRIKKREKIGDTQSRRPRWEDMIGFD